MKIKIVLLTGFIICCGCLNAAAQDMNMAEQAINETLETWHRAAAAADFEDYVDQMTEDAVFIGTDPEENWQQVEFEKFAKPYFDKGKAWGFTALERHIYLDESKKTAWFDELLDTQMGICRGSGVLVKMGDKWKIKQYVLSIAVPNGDVAKLTELKQTHDAELIKKLTLANKK